MARRKRLSNREIYRYWVEVRELAGGPVRELPLAQVRVVCLKRGKKNEHPVPDRELLRLTDGTETWEVETFDELRVRLREKYPDAEFERTLHYVRDHEAEERYENGLNALMDILVRGAVDDEIAKDAALPLTRAPKP